LAGLVATAKGWPCMIFNPRDSQDLGHHLALAQVGTEMVAPIAVGWLLDYSFGWAPWGIVAGAVLGLIAGLGHLVSLRNRQNERKRPRPGQEDT
jgi:F0F1-type ATP synthase assembly protein I